MKQRGDHAEREHHTAAAEITDHVDGGRRLFTGAAIGVEGAGQRDIVDVMAGGMGIGARLAPAGHAAINQFWIVGEQGFGAKAEPFGDAGAEALDQAIGGFDELADLGLAFGGFQIDADEPA